MTKSLKTKTRARKRKVSWADYLNAQGNLDGIKRALMQRVTAELDNTDGMSIRELSRIIGDDAVNLNKVTRGIWIGPLVEKAIKYFDKRQ